MSPSEQAQLQLNAFLMRSNAAIIRRNVSAPLDSKAELAGEGKYYRLETPDEPILDPTVLEAIENLYPILGRLELEDKWGAPVSRPVFAEPVRREPVIIQKAVVQPETSFRIAEEIPSGIIIEEKREVAVPSIALQVAIYIRESQAIRAQRKIMSKLNLPVEIVKQFDYYHVIVTGFYSREETFEYYPELAGLGFPGITLIQDYKKQK